MVIRILLTLCVAVFSIFNLQACDVCGCSATGDSWGMMPNFNRSFFGVRSQWRAFESVHPDTGDEFANLPIRDDFFRTDITMRWGLSQRLGLLAQMPYRYNLREEGKDNSVHQGWGDASMQAQFLVLKPSLRLWQHALFISGGIEMPTGKFKFSHDIPSMLQPGSGTWDKLFGINYTLKRKGFGVNLEANYRDNGQIGTYEWGDVMSANLRLFAKIQADSMLQIIPWIGAGYEHYERNTENTVYDISAAYTGGYVMPLNAGVDVFAEKYSVSIDAGIPMVNSFSDDFGKMKIHLGVKLIFYIRDIQIFNKNNNLNFNYNSNEK